MDRVEKYPYEVAGRTALLSPAAVAKMHNVNRQTILNAVEDKIIMAAVYILGPGRTVVSIGITHEEAAKFRPRSGGRRKKAHEDD